ncbi:MAG: aspartate kinase [Calditrichaeota bacterium]|nr:aspartate kinase [Calditrichota bacterium]
MPVDSNNTLKNIVVQKYGGTSVGDIEKMKRVAQRIAAEKERGRSVVAVISAMGKTTDELVNMARQVHQNPPRREMDLLLSVGEQISIALLSMALNDMGYPCISLLGHQAGIQTDGQFANAHIETVNKSRILKHLNEDKIVLVAGFQGISQDGEITTLGRGGSDLTAVALAAILEADRCEIYTDVDGIFTTDPRYFKKARLLPFISYSEMLELASEGAQVMQTRAVEVARKYHVPLVIRNSFKQNSGTWIIGDETLEKVAITGIAFDKQVDQIRIKDYSKDPKNFLTIFGKLAQENINIKIIVQGASSNGNTSISFLVSSDQLGGVKRVLDELQSRRKNFFYEVDTDVSKIAVVGSGIASTPGTAYRVFQTLLENQIPILSISTSEIKIACVVPEGLAETAVAVLHDEFGLEDIQRRKIA